MTAPVPGQPTLRDGDVVIRPLSEADAEPAPWEPPDGVAHWIDPGPDASSTESVLDRLHEVRSAYADDRRQVAFGVERDGRLAGTVAVRQEGVGVGHLCWALDTGHRGRGTMTRALRLLVRYALSDLGLHRVFACVDLDDVASLRVASRAGLRREGVLRGYRRLADQRGDVVLVARLRDDPEPASPDGFRAMLNAGLPTKRVIAQGLIRDPARRVLLCELVYKSDWDLPGGVVEPGESPREAVVREVREELGVDVLPGRLLAVDWLPPWAGWDDACVLVFDLGVHDAGLAAKAVLEPREIAAVHWCAPGLVLDRARPPTAARVEQAHARSPTVGAVFLHSGQPPEADTPAY